MQISFNVNTNDQKKQNPFSSDEMLFCIPYLLIGITPNIFKGNGLTNTWMSW